MRSILRRLLGREPEEPQPDVTDPDVVYMPAPLNPRRVERAIVRGGQTVSLRQLREFGLSAVRVIDGHTIQRVVRETLEQALRERPASAPPLSSTEREEVEAAASARVMELLQQNQRLEARHAEVERRRAALESQARDLRHELEERLAELQAERGKVVRQVVHIDEESFVEMEARVLRLLDRLARDGELVGPDGQVDLRAVERELGELLHRVVAEVRERHTVDHGARVEELELRIAKLNQALEEREDALRRLAAMKGYDGGVASIFDAIQGLDPTSLEFQKKSELLKEVYLQNLELQGLDILVADQQFPIKPVAAIPEIDPLELGIPTPSALALSDEPAY